MNSPALTACLCVLLLPTIRGLQSEDREERLCAFSNYLQRAESASINGRRRVVKENATIRCSRGSSCYGLWENLADGEMLLLKQGCWTFVGNQHECHDDGCFLATAVSSQMQKDNYRFCCCKQNLCNANYTKAPPTTTSPNHHQFMSKQSAVTTMVTVTTAAILIMALFLGYRGMKRREKLRLSGADVMEAANAEATREDGSLKLLELIGRGRYGAVFRGSLNGQRVAVKVFSSANRKNFLSERSMNCLLQQHHNIARFLTAEEKMSTDGHEESLIVMEFYPHGCLSEYLSLHTVDWLTCCRMTHDVTKGLSFLHTELHRGEQYKPAVAHRDLTSRNVLVRADLSCVLAGFGASVELTSTKPRHPEDDDSMAVREVGTVPYISPEVLGRGLNSALKRVDIYALGLLYWESFRRCSDLFPGETVPLYQLAFQKELGNHRRSEDMQVLVLRDRCRPEFPEAWKRNSLAVWSLKETMEDCWEQDSEERLTAQCAEQRLAGLKLLSPHTQLDNHRSLCHSWRSSQAGSVHAEDSQSAQRKHLQHEEQHAALLCEAKAVEKSCKSDLEFQQPQVEKNFRETSDHLMELKQFGSQLRAAHCERLQSTEQQTLPQRPTSLHLPPKKKITSASSRPPLGKFKSLYRQVETGVAKMNRVREFSVLAEPHLVTTVTNNAIVRSSSVNGKGVNSVCRSSGESVPGRVNPAGPQNEEEVEVKLEIGIKGDDRRRTPLNCGPEEHEPLLRMEQLPAESEPHPPHQNKAGNISTRLGSNSNNNNNSPAPHTQTCPSGSGVGVLKAGLGQAAETLSGYSASVSQQEQEILGPGLRSPSLYNGTLTVQVPLTIQNEADGSDKSPHQKTAKKASALDLTQEDHLIGSAVIIASSDPEKALETKAPAALQAQLSQELDPPSKEAGISDTLTCLQTPSSSEPSSLEDPSMYQEASPLTPEIAKSKANLAKGSKSQHEDLQIPTGEPEAPDLMHHPKARRRPCSLELSSSCTSSDDVSMSSDGSLTATGMKIKQRVKTPYTLKKWCTTSWVASADSSLDSDFECSTRASGSCQVAPGVQRGRVGIQRMNQSKSSMAVFVVGRGSGVVATKTSEHEGMICF
ncbi:hypothetical protein OJAV_G00210130 [Oryzias javanicus]|uniref:Serine/threonine-protein kinase receptor n=1 Tax=Oryzias javanicus TaxID=123683 RepID=A0A437C7C6_ORYJA|nr:hypothetical protein OJAV_G00210130 [Oryzias javanicus]